jgi:hypothetical protein
MMIQLIIWQLLMACVATTSRDDAIDDGPETIHEDGVKAPQHLKTRRPRHPKNERHHLVAEDVVLGLDHHLHPKNEHHDAVDLDLCGIIQSRNCRGSRTRRVDALTITTTASRRCGIATTPSTQLQARKSSENTLSQHGHHHVVLRAEAHLVERSDTFVDALV